MGNINTANNKRVIIKYERISELTEIIMIGKEISLILNNMEHSLKNSLNSIKTIIIGEIN